MYVVASSLVSCVNKASFVSLKLDEHIEQSGYELTNYRKFTLLFNGAKIINEIAHCNVVLQNRF